MRIKSALVCTSFMVLQILMLLCASPRVYAQTAGLQSGRARVDINDSTRVDKITNEASPFAIPSISIKIDPAKERSQLGAGLQILILLTVLSLAPSILMMLTSFIRTLIVLSFVRRALGTQQEPSNQIVIGLALFITFFTMSPVLQQAYDNGIKPYIDQKINYVEAYHKTAAPIREFMFKHTRKSDLILFAGAEGGKKPQTKQDYSTLALIPAFVCSELKTAFQMGVVIYLPFLVIDMLIASLLMSMGMMMLPPVMISLPFKILLFVLADGWHLVIKAIIVSFGGNA